MRKFTATEWHDLARGCRALAVQEEKSLEQNKGTTVAPQFERSRQHFLEMAKECEEWANVAPPD
jgi:hypothetical protein